MHPLRKLWHLSGGLTMVLFYSYGMKRDTGVLILFSLFTLSVVMEFLRFNFEGANNFFVKFFKPLMRTSEVSKVNGVVFYLASCTLAIAVFPKPVAILSVLYLALGDPISSVFGILFGKDKIFENKSLQGSLAGFVTCMLITLCYFYFQNIYIEKLFIISLLGGMAGAIAEMLPVDIDDNFSIPIVSGFFVWLCIMASAQ